jgi:phage terminase small subunit
MGTKKPKSAYDALSDRHKVFVDTYVSNRWNATAAARAAGLKHPEVQGCRLLRNVKVRAAIDERLAEYKLTANETLALISDQAKGTLEDFLDGSNELDLKQARERGKLHLVRKFKTTVRTDKEGETSVTKELELYNAQEALSLLARHHGLLNDKVKVDAEIGGLGELVEAILHTGRGGREG